ncbi:MAG: glycosyltransferase family 2 protein [Chloroflexi bacterium]|nr:glycosyltransferase family 2 protein [Chloroflexota bacterium]
MDLGIVIVNWNVRDLLAACLDSVYLDLAQSGGQLSGVVCVVDNGSTDGSVEMLRAQFPRTRLIESENCGMGAGNNLGLRALGFENSKSQTPNSRPPFAALILNPDTIVRPGALRQLVEFLRAHPRAGVAAPKLVNPDGSLQHPGFRFPGLLQAALDLFPPPGRLSGLLNSPLNGRYPAQVYAAGAPFPVEHTLGAAFGVRGEAIAECGLFDETFTLYCEEIDWQWRMARAGWERWVVPAAEIVHYGGQSTSQAPTDSFLKLWSSRRRLYYRYHTPALNAIVSRLVQVGMRQRIRENHRRSQRGELAPDRRAELNLALNEIIRIWQGRRPSVKRDP